ncbi:MAG: hypothetical protein QW356_07820 [Candidatus Hadarchaeales archaeon]
MRWLDEIEWLKEFPVDTLQIYFPCSLELQEELIKKGFKVPADISKKILTPIPIIYCNFRGWITQPEPITIERLIPPDWYGKNPQQLGWKDAGRYKGKQAYHLPPEEVYVRLGHEGDRIYFKFEIHAYHLERTSIRGVNPEKWNNWMMFYLSADYIEELLGFLRHLTSRQRTLYPILEKQQGGKEKTYYASPVATKSLGIPVSYYSFCLGCFDESLSYFRRKAIQTNLKSNIVDQLRLRLEHKPTINSGLKVGVAKIEGKRKQLMFKLCSDTPIQISGILKPRIIGKARGELCPCDHTSKIQILSAKVVDVYSALLVTKPMLSKL